MLRRQGATYTHTQHNRQNKPCPQRPHNALPTNMHAQKLKKGHTCTHSLCVSHMVTHLPVDVISHKHVTQV